MLVSATHQHESAIGVYMFPPSWTSHPPHLTPQGCHRVLDLKSLHHTANLHWLFLHMVMYMFQYYSFSSSLSLLPALCWQVCSLCLHLNCCPANRFISTIYLDSNIWVNIWYLFFSFWLISLCIIRSNFFQLIRTDSNIFLFMDE